MLRTAVERFGAHVAMGAGAAGAAAVSAPTARCAKDDAKAITPSFDPEALERGAKALREINKSAYAKNVRAHPHLTTASAAATYPRDARGARTRSRAQRARVCSSRCELAIAVRSHRSEHARRARRPRVGHRGPTIFTCQLSWDAP